MQEYQPFRRMYDLLFSYIVATKKVCIDKHKGSLLRYYIETKTRVYDNACS